MSRRCTNLVELGYTADDTGVYAVCDNIVSAMTYCGFVKQLGWRPNLKDVVQAQREHDLRELP